MKITKLIFLLAICFNSFSQTQVGSIDIDGEKLPIYIKQSEVDAIISKIKGTTTTTPPIIVTPPVVVTPINNIGVKIDSYRYDQDTGFVITFKVNGFTPQEISWDGSKYYPFSVVYLPANNKGVYYLKTNGVVKKISVQAKSSTDIPIIGDNPDSEPVVVPPVIDPVIEQTQPTTSSTRPLIGAVRWDWWTDNFECTTKWLAPNKWHYKAPFFAVETGENSLELKGSTQEVFDKELEYANYAGIDYFAFDWYRGEGVLWNGVYGRTLFKSSTKKGKVKMAYILEATSLGGEFNSQTLKNICTDFGRDDYQKINGRPLFFYMTYPPLTPSQVDIINKTYSDIYPNSPLPYIVNAIQVGEQEAQMNNRTGIASWSQYTGYSQQGDINMRERFKRAEVKLIPTLTVGWDTRPIAEQPCSWYQNAPHEKEYRLTGQDLKNHLIDTINFVKANPTTCEANTILCYAWNENAEGGYIVPTLVPGTNRINTDTIEIFRQVLNPTQKEY